MVDALQGCILTIIIITIIITLILSSLSHILAGE